MHRRQPLARRATESNPLLLPSPSLLRAAPRANFARAPRSLPSFLPFLPSDTHSAPAIACPRATKTNQYPPSSSPLHFSLSRPRLLFLFFFSFFFSPLHLVVDTFTSFFFFPLPYSYVRVGWHTRDKRSGFRVLGKIG